MKKNNVLHVLLHDGKAIWKFISLTINRWYLPGALVKEGNNLFSRGEKHSYLLNICVINCLLYIKYKIIKGTLDFQSQIKYMGKRCKCIHFEVIFYFQSMN